VLRAVHAAGGWAWQMFTENDVRTFAPAEAVNCSAAYRRACSPRSSHQTRMTSHKLSLRDSHSPGALVDAKSDVARFLLLRGPYAYLGTGWVGCLGQGASRHSNESE
jgi:hypothetical protein